MTGKILIVDDVATNRIILKVKLSEGFYDTLLAGDGATALALARDEAPDLILLDIGLPDMDGVEFCRRLRSDPVTRRIPIIVITADLDVETRIRALHAGVNALLGKPLAEQVLLARIRSILRAREAEEELRLREATGRELGLAEAAPEFERPGLIGLIADRPETAMHWRARIAPHLADRLVVLTRAEALSDAPGLPAPDAFILAADLGRARDGLRLMSDLRSRPATRHAAICVAHGHETTDLAAMALDLGASDLIELPFDPREVALRLRLLMRTKRHADLLRATVRDGLRLAVSDPLTGLFNRRYALPHLARIAERAHQNDRDYAVMVLDLDCFKSVNDRWGHAAGDAVLVEVARRLRENLRAVDLLARIGGEEFLVGLPDTNLATASVAAERLRRVVEERPVRLPTGAGAVSVTLSIGLALSDHSAPDTSVEDLINRADRALLASKSDGRNQVTISSSAA